MNDGSSRKSQLFRLDPPVEKLSRKRLSRKGPFLTVQESPIWTSVENGRPVSTDKSDCLYTKGPKGTLLTKDPFESGTFIFNLSSCVRFDLVETYEFVFYGEITYCVLSNVFPIAIMQISISSESFGILCVFLSVTLLLWKLAVRAGGKIGLVTAVSFFRRHRQSGYDMV